MPLDKHDTPKDIGILLRENRERSKSGKKPRSRAQVIAIALSVTGKGHKK